MAIAYLGDKVVLDCYLGGDHVSESNLGETDVCSGALRLKMTVVSTEEPTFNVSGGSVSVTDIGNDTWKIESLDPITRIAFSDSFDASAVTSVQCKLAMDLTSMRSMFYPSVYNPMSNMTSITFDAGWETYDIDDMSFAFKDCSGLTTLDLSTFNTSNLIDAHDMFNGCSNLESLDISSFVTTSVTSLEYMFSECESLLSLDLSNFDTTNNYSLEYTFYRCRSLTSLDLSSFRTTALHTMEYTFGSCDALETLDMSWFDTTNVTLMNGTFSLCSNLTSIPDLDRFSTYNVTTMESMFHGCSSLVDPFTEHLRATSLNSTDSMFYGCSSITHLDLTSMDTSSVDEMSVMFKNCSSLKCITNIDTTGATSRVNMFDGCTSLERPNASEQSDILNGSDWTNSDQCPNPYPIVEAGDNKSVNEGDVVTITATASDPNGETLTYLWEEGTTELSTELSVNYTSNTIGDHTLTFTATNTSGLSSSDSMTVTVNEIASPIVDAGEDKDIIENESVTITGTASDPNGETLTYVWKEGATQLATALSFDYTSGTIGEHELTLSATNESGKTASDSMVVTVNQSPYPIVSAGDDITVPAGQSANITGTASDPNGESLTYVWKEGEEQISTSLSFTVISSTAGVHVYTLTATNESGYSSSDDMTLTYVGYPEVDAGPDRTANEDETITITGTASDPQGETLTYDWKSGGTSLATTLSFTYSSTVIGDSTLTLSATNESGLTSSDDMVVTIIGYPDVDAGDNKTVTVNESVTITGTASDPQGETMTYEWKEGSTVLATTISFDYSNSNAGTHTFTFTATNESGLSSSDDMTVTVESQSAGGWEDDATVVNRGTVNYDTAVNNPPSGGRLPTADELRNYTNTAEVEWFWTADVVDTDNAIAWYDSERAEVIVPKTEKYFVRYYIEGS